MKYTLTLTTILMVTQPIRADLRDNTATKIATAVEQSLTLQVPNPRRRVHVRHCRSARPGCLARVAALSQILADAAITHGVDPFLLTAVAMKESGMNPFALGQHGERGIIQLNPRGVGSRVLFVTDRRFRQQCARQVGACQEEPVNEGATLLARSIERCDSVEEGLGMYNTGVCQITSYSARVLSERLRLLHLVKGATMVSSVLTN